MAMADNDAAGKKGPSGAALRASRRLDSSGGPECRSKEQTTAADSMA
jgi:hypothetical protein